MRRSDGKTDVPSKPLSFSWATLSGAASPGARALWLVESWLQSRAGAGVSVGWLRLFTQTCSVLERSIGSTCRLHTLPCLCFVSRQRDGPRIFFHLFEVSFFSMLGEDSTIGKGTVSFPHDKVEISEMTRWGSPLWFVQTKQTKACLSRAPLKQPCCCPSILKLQLLLFKNSFKLYLN